VEEDDKRQELLTAALAKARLVALDVDGCLTDGRVVHGPGGETQSFCVYDGQGLKFLQREGVTVCLITGRGSPATHTRAAELGIDELFTKVTSKEEVLRSIQDRLRITVEETVAMGDDLPDLALARASAVFASPSNARAEIRDRADLVTRAEGGRGAVRELCEEILRAKGRWDAILAAAVG
jgi:3-deoxy-D-manno-octulosonate 8-phosphate phosphatase (KDO 8-P phosphatase)